MDPQQPGAPNPGNNYDFILNPTTPQAPKGMLGARQNSFVMRLAVIIGGAVVLIIVAMLMVNLLFGSKINTGDLVLLTQTEQEIVRLSREGNQATDQAVKNAAINTQLSLQSHQQVWLAYLGRNGHTVSPQQLLLKKNAQSDLQLKAAKQTSTFDTALTSIVRGQLEAYASLLQTTYSHATSQQAKDLLRSHYQETKLLLQQWPASP